MSRKIYGRPIVTPINPEKFGSGGGGEDGFSPIATVTQTADGAVIEITDKDGKTTATITNGEDGYTPVKGKDYFDGEPGYTPVKGKDYFTNADKQEIAQQAAGLVEIPTGGGFVASDTPPEDTSLLWVDTSDNSGGGSNVDFPTDEHINALIDAKLGVIENGTY